MSADRLVALTAALAAGVALPKVIPAALVGTRVGERTARFLALLPAATLAALATIGALRPDHGLHPRPSAVVGVAAAVMVAALTRRTLLSMTIGWAAALAFELLGR